MLTRHIWESLQVTPGPFPDFWAGPGDEAMPPPPKEFTSFQMTLTNVISSKIGGERGEIMGPFINQPRQPCVHGTLCLSLSASLYPSLSAITGPSPKGIVPMDSGFSSHQSLMAGVQCISLHSNPIAVYLVE